MPSTVEIEDVIDALDDECIYAEVNGALVVARRDKPTGQPVRVRPVYLATYVDPNHEPARQEFIKETAASAASEIARILARLG